MFLLPTSQTPRTTLPVQMESLLTTTREALEQRLAAAENAATTATAELASHRRLADSQARAAADRLSAESTAAKAAQREARQAWQREARKAEARVLEKAEGEAEASTAALKKEMGEAVETMARREGEASGWMCRCQRDGRRSGREGGGYAAS